MDKEVKKKFDELLKSLSCKRACKVFDWNGYEVFRPDTSHLPVFRGIPRIILVRDKEIRLSTDDEFHEYYNFSIEMRNRLKSTNQVEKKQIIEIDR